MYLLQNVVAQSICIKGLKISVVIGNVCGDMEQPFTI